MIRLFSGIEEQGDRIALVEENGKTHTYSELTKEADQLAQPLRDFKGLLALEATNELEPILALIGACRTGCPILLVEEGDLESKRNLRRGYQPEFEFSRKGGSWALRKGGVPLGDKIHPDLAILLSTSGSTGSSKQVRLSHENLRSNGLSIIEYLGIENTERAITALQFNYSFGLSVITSHLHGGASISLTSKSVLEDGFWAQFERQNATSVSGVPRSFEMLSRSGFLDRSIAGLRTITQAGGRLRPELVEAFASYASRNHARFYVMYGQTEASPRMSYLPPESTLENSDSIGVAVPGGRFRILDANGFELQEPDTPGELFYTGPNVMMGYSFSRAELGLGNETGELKTGDITLRKPNGFIKLVGRASRFVKIAGLRIGLDDVESYAKGEGIVCSVAGTDEGVVVAVDDQRLAAAELEKKLVREFRIPAGSLAVVCFKELPVLSTGKPDYQSILKSDTAKLEYSPEATLRLQLASLLGVDELDDDDTFFSAGGDSLSYVEASILIERNFGRRIPGWDRMPFCKLFNLGGEDAPEVRIGLDRLLIARSIAIYLAMTSHAFIQFRVWELLPGVFRLFTRMATPSFLVIFGMGLARSYLGRSDDQTLAKFFRWSLPKALTVYIAIILTQACAIVGRKSSIEEFFNVLIFSSPGLYVDLLTIYCGLYFVGPFLVRELERQKFFGLLLLLILPWAFRPSLTSSTNDSYFLGLLYGSGGVVGPSVLHATTFVIFGYALGARGKQNNLFGVAVVLFVASALYLAYAIVNNSLEELGRGIANMNLRKINHPFYYAYGILSALLVLGLSQLLSRVQTAYRGWRIVFGIGANSLFAFTFGNMLLNLGPVVKVAPAWSRFLLWALFLIGLSLLSYDINQTKPRFFGPISRGIKTVTRIIFGIGPKIFSRKTKQLEPPL